LVHTLYKYSKTRKKRADDDREIEEERKRETENKGEKEERSELMGTADRGEKEIYQKTRDI